MKINKDKITKNIAFFVFDQVEVLDLNGPLDVFVKANIIVPNSFNCYTVALDTAPVFSESNTMQIIPNYTIDNCPQADLIIVPGAFPETVIKLFKDEQFESRLTAWITTQAQSDTVIVSICTGALLLSNTTLLDTKAITSHFMITDLLQELNPNSKVVTGPRYIDEGNLVTTAGITAGIDAALYMVTDILGKDVAQQIIEIFEYKSDLQIH